MSNGGRLLGASTPDQPTLVAIRDGVLRGLEFTGITGRTTFWWFALAVAMLLALARLLAEATVPLPLQIASLVVLLPWIAVCTRRLRNAGLSPWWQLTSLVRVAGIVALLWLLIYPGKTVTPVTALDK